MTFCALCHYEIVPYNGVWILSDRAFAGTDDRDWCQSLDHRPLERATVVRDFVNVYSS